MKIGDSFDKIELVGGNRCDQYAEVCGNDGVRDPIEMAKRVGEAAAFRYREAKACEIFPLGNSRIVGRFELTGNDTPRFWVDAEVLEGTPQMIADEFGIIADNHVTALLAAGYRPIRDRTGELRFVGKDDVVSPYLSSNSDFTVPPRNGED